MNAREFFVLVKRMRERQKEYFRYRSPYVLRECKELEAMVDGEIKRAEAVLYARMNPELFGEEEQRCGD